MFSSVTRCSHKRWCFISVVFLVTTWMPGGVRAPGSPGGDIGCNPGWSRVERTCYKLAGSEVATWFEADNLCKASRARLISLDSHSDDIIIKNLRAKVPENGLHIWARHNPTNRNAAVSDDLLTELTCFGLDVAPGRPVSSSLGLCLSFRPFICEASIDQGPTGRAHWTGDVRYDHDHHQLQPAVNILKLSGGILAGIIIGLLLWIALGIGMVVYIRRKKSARREIRRILDDGETATPAATSSVPAEKDDEVNLEPLQATEVLMESSCTSSCSSSSSTSDNPSDVEEEDYDPEAALRSGPNRKRSSNNEQV